MQDVKKTPLRSNESRVLEQTRCCLIKRKKKHDAVRKRLSQPLFVFKKYGTQADLDLHLFLMHFEKKSVIFDVFFFTFCVNVYNIGHASY